MGSIQFPVAELGTADLIAQVIIEMPAAAQDLLPFSSDIKVGDGFPIFIDNEPLFIRFKGKGPLF